MTMMSLGGVPSLGMLTGVHGSESLLKTINSDMNNSNFFGSIDDIMAKGREMFIQNVIQPIRAIGNTVRNLVGMLDYDEKIIPINSEELLGKIPACMHDPIMRFAPVRKLFDQGRIFGFGWDHIPEEDIYARIINNGYVPDIAEAVDKNGEFEFKYEWHSTDPVLSFEEIESIEETRNYLEKFLEETDFDPTDYPNFKG